MKNLDKFGTPRRRAGWHRGFGTTLALLALAHAPAHAADAVPGAGVYEIEPVVITATRTEIGVRESPAAISVVTAQQIERRIEVVRGPYSALYGSHAMGGVSLLFRRRD